MSITTQNRWDSFEKLDNKRLCDLIISTLSDNVESGLTAREIAVILYNQGYIRSNERQATQPRLTELVDAEKVLVVGKRLDNMTRRKVAVYSVADSYLQKEKVIDDTTN